jgi:hypothetical protein
MGNRLHEVPSSGGNIYPHLSNPCHVPFSSQPTSSVMIPLQPFMNQFGGGYYPVGQGHGVYQNPSWPTISQNYSFMKPLSQMLQLPTTSHAGSTGPTIASHTGIISPTSASHVGDRSTTSTSHVEDQQPATACHAGSTTLVTASHTTQSSPTSASHVGDMLLASTSHARSMPLSTTSHFGGIHMIEKP